MSQVKGLRLLQRLTNNCQRLQFIHTQPKKRFYKNVSVVQANGKYEINLDHRKLKTPLGSPLLVINILQSEVAGGLFLVCRSPMNLSPMP